ncbi:hypothetical protein VN0250_10230 [Helicobacter pylori]
MNFKKAIIAYLPHKRMEIQGIKNNILCYNETFKWCAKNANQHKKGAYYHGKQKHSSG